MEEPLTVICPLCGGEMEPRGRARRGRAVYTCTECGHETILEAGTIAPAEERLLDEIDDEDDDAAADALEDEDGA
jgi:DNA-binding PadR family transcriptional regulator